MKPLAALLLLAGGITLVMLIWSRIRRTLIRLMQRPGDRAPP